MSEMCFFPMLLRQLFVNNTVIRGRAISRYLVCACALRDAPYDVKVGRIIGIILQSASKKSVFRTSGLPELISDHNCVCDHVTGNLYKFRSSLIKGRLINLTLVFAEEQTLRRFHENNGWYRNDSKNLYRIFTTMCDTKKVYVT